MATAEQIKSLIKSYSEGDDDRFFSSAMQIAASEARQGHTTLAQELKTIIEQARKNRFATFPKAQKTVSISQPRRELQELIDVFYPKIKLGDMILSPDVKDSLERLIREQRRWEVLKQHNLSPRRKLLLVGSPGTGKTMTAQAIAGELGLPVYIIRLDGLMSKYMGESIAKLRVIFDAMPDHRGVYLFDEFDSIGSHRNQGQDVGEIKRVLNSFLIHIEKDHSNSIIIAATNLPDSLDSALHRRFDDVIVYPLPDQDEIIATIKKNTKGFSFAKRVSYKKLSEEAASLNYSDVTRACEEAIKEMILEGYNHLRYEDLSRALRKRKA